MYILQFLGLSEIMGGFLFLLVFHTINKMIKFNKNYFDITRRKVDMKVK